MSAYKIPRVVKFVDELPKGSTGKILKRAIEPFFSSKPLGKGTGLGLSIVYGIAKDAGGTVMFSTTPGAGTTFEVVLPLVLP